MLESAQLFELLGLFEAESVSTSQISAKAAENSHKSPDVDSGARENFRHGKAGWARGRNRARSNRGPAPPSPRSGLAMSSPGAKRLAAVIISSFRILEQRVGEAVDQLRADQRLVPLDVDDVRDAAQLRRHFGDAVRAAASGGARSSPPRRRRPTPPGDADVIGGDDDARDFTRPPAPLPDMLDERAPGDEVQRLARETGRTPTGREDGDDSFWHAGVYGCTAPRVQNWGLILSAD